MLSLIVALSTPAAATGELRFVLSRDAASGLLGEASHAGNDAAIAEHGSAPLALLPRSDELVAVVPAHMLSWQRIVLPKLGSARLRAALDGMLEERLLDEPAQLHLALSPGAATGQSVWVAACDKAWLQAWLQAFEAAGRIVARVVPEFAPPLASSAAEQAASYYALGEPHNAWLLRCASDGVQSLPLNASARSALAWPSQADAAQSPPTVFAEPAVAALAEQILGSKVQLRHNAQGLVAAARSGWDLAQFDLASTGGTRLARRASLAWAQWAGSPAWRPARWGVVALLVINLLGLNAWAWKERSALEAQRAQVRNLLTSTFPKIPLVVDAPVQMERELTALRAATGAVGARDLEPMLAGFAANTKAEQAPTAIEFVANELTLKGLKLPTNDANALRTALAAAGYSVREEAGNWVLRVAAP